MPVGSEDFEAGIDGSALHMVMECLSTGQGLTEREIQERTDLTTKMLNIALPQLVDLGKIQKKWIVHSYYYLQAKAAPRQDWYTIDEAANYLRVSRRTVYQLLQEGQLAGYRVGKGGHRRLRLGDLNQVMKREDPVETYAMNAVADPVLAELWDNEKDAEYDNL